MPVLAAVLALLIGLGVGWLAFGRDRAPVPSAAQRETLLRLEESGDYDPGSVRLVGAQYGAQAWRATQDDAKTQCVVITSGERVQAGCQPADPDEAEYDFGLQAMLSVEDEDGEHAQISALLLRDPRGEEFVFMNRFGGSEGWDWRSQYEPDELAIAEFLDAEGYPGDTLQIVGYDEDMPIWLTQQGRDCLILARPDALIAQACGDPDQSGTDFTLTRGDVTYRLHFPDMRAPVLTVVRSPASIVCDMTTGDCISANDSRG